MKAIGDLTKRLTKLSVADDKRLSRLMGYTKQITKLRLAGKIGNSIDDLKLSFYTDADRCSGVDHKIDKWTDNGTGRDRNMVSSGMGFTPSNGDSTQHHRSRNDQLRWVQARSVKVSQLKNCSKPFFRNP